MNFSEREKAFEDKFMHDEEVMFQIRARRNMQVGLWAAKEMGISGLDANDYAKELVTGMYDKERLWAKLREDFDKSGKTIIDAELFSHINAFVVSARNYFMETQDETSSSV